MLLSGLTLILSLFLPFFGDVEPTASRHHDVVRIQHALDIHKQIGGASVSNREVEEKLSSMSDEELKQFADSLETKNHIADPMVVVVASIAMLILVVGLIVRWVD